MALLEVVRFIHGDNNARRPDCLRTDCHAEEVHAANDMTHFFQREAGTDNKSTHIFICDQSRDLGFSAFAVHPPFRCISLPPFALSRCVRAITTDLPADIFDPPPTQK